MTRIRRCVEWKDNLDRFIPNPVAMDWDHARSVMAWRHKEKKRTGVFPPWKEAYHERLAEAYDLNRRILVFGNRPRPSVERIPSSPTSCHSKFSKPWRQVPERYERMLDAPDLVDDYSLNLLDWGDNNLLAIALGSTVYLWNASNRSTTELVTVDEGGPVTSIAWSPDGGRIAIGLNNSHVQLWDPQAEKKVRTFRDGHRLRVGSLAWRNQILSTGGRDGKILNNDTRARSHIVNSYRGHRREVCGLKWSYSGQYLASGGHDKLLHIWDRSAASSNSSCKWLHRMNDHNDTVRALSWCPFQDDLLASGGGSSDRCIKLWNAETGAILNSFDTGSEVCSLLWSKSNRELLSSHGSSQYQLILWRYPTMWKMAELKGHTSRVLFMAQSPDGCTVASAAGDETLRFWNVFGSPEEAAKISRKINREPFAPFNFIR